MSQIFGAVPWVKVRSDGSAYVEARFCDVCEANITHETLACPSCGVRNSMRVREVAGSGKLHSYSIVHRSFPGIAVPFISAVVDMDDGTVLKGNLRGVEATPESIAFGMGVRLVFGEAGTDSRQNTYVTYFFEAA